MSPVLEISGLRAAVGGKEILQGVDLVVGAGEVHAVMGPNGSGKSTLSFVLAGHPRYEVLGGSVKVNGTEILGLAPWQRSAAGLFLALQYPTEVPGVPVRDVLAAALEAAGRSTTDLDERIRTESARIGFEDRFMERAMNVDLSGGEKKRNETVQLGVLEPAVAVLDEIDSGLDIDALRAVSRRVEEATAHGLAVVAITHYRRLFAELAPDVVHVFAAGRIQRSGGPELAEELEATGYVEP